MAIPGVAWACPTGIIVDTLIKYKGKIQPAAKELGVNWYTLQKRIKREPDLVDLLDDLRHGYCEVLADDAETVMSYALSQAQDQLGHAVNAAKYLLDAHGKRRGYGDAKEDAKDGQKKIDQFMDTANEFIKLRSKEPILAAEELPSPSAPLPETQLDDNSEAQQQYHSIEPAQTFERKTIKFDH